VIKQIVPQKFCLKCKGCCRFSEKDSVWLPHDRRISAVSSKEENNFLCKFLNPKDNKCKIYSSRPFDCQLYPFLLNRQGNQVFLAVDLNCLFVKEKRDSKELKDYMFYLEKLLNEPVYKELLENNPKIIQLYEGVSSLIALSD
jgi:Fe-S-cluster containining protein